MWALVAPTVPGGRDAGVWREVLAAVLPWFFPCPPPNPPPQGGRAFLAPSPLVGEGRRGGCGDGRRHAGNICQTPVAPGALDLEPSRALRSLHLSRSSLIAAAPALGRLIRSLSLMKRWILLAVLAAGISTAATVAVQFLPGSTATDTSPVFPVSGA